MINFIKKNLYKLFGQDTYLKILHRGFDLMYRTGCLKNNYIYKFHYFVKSLIKPGDTVVDIGANLGYYTYIFSNLVGDKAI